MHTSPLPALTVDPLEAAEAMRAAWFSATVVYSPEDTAPPSVLELSQRLHLDRAHHPERPGERVTTVSVAGRVVLAVDDATFTAMLRAA